MQSKKITLALIVNIILLIAGLICITVGCFKLITNEVALATTGLGAGLLFLFSATIERFESLKGMSLEVTTRKLDDKIHEASEVVKELKQLAEISGHTLSLLAARVGRWGGSFTFEESYLLAQQVRDNLTSLKCEKNTITHALNPWVTVVIADLGRKLLAPVTEELNALEQQLRRERDKIPQPIKADDPAYLELVQKINALSTHMHPGCDVSALDSDKTMAAIETYVSTAPELDTAAKLKHLDNIKQWSSEVDFLLRQSDVKNPSLWIEMLKQK
ncbi:hypothetical protein [Pseudomonas sp. FP2300]|uniref:hypothetical protein n=1 Tax=Pseudomonas sp. FP2300 TaxID=2954090 RepID=UPI002733153D|nr:hypothetical protein [Pseudomonas sp. FP2300]WLH64839.1 hypothetical protein PSH86_09820 [Pseudomonas sp. FP2300]